MRKLICTCTFTALCFSMFALTSYESTAAVKKLKFTPLINKPVNRVEVKTKKIKSSDNVINIDLKIPIIAGMQDKALQERLNAEFEKKQIGFKNEIESQARDYYKESQEEGLHFNRYEVFTESAVPYNKNDLLSIIADLYSYTGGAHGMTYRVPYNIDLKTGKQILLSDLFKEGTNYKDIINKEISKQIAADTGKYYFEGAFKGISDNHQYYLKDDSLVIYFDLYEIAPYVSGIPEFAIPLSLFGDNLNPQFISR